MKRVLLILLVLILSSCYKQNSGGFKSDSNNVSYSNDDLSRSSSISPVTSSFDDGFVDFDWGYEEYEIQPEQVKAMNEFTEEDWEEHYKSHFGIVKDDSFVYCLRHKEAVDYTILRCFSKAKTVTIPDTFNDRNVASVMLGAFCQCTNMEVLNIGKNIRSLNPSAFENCLSLKQVNVENENNNVVFRNNAIYLDIEGKSFLNYVLKSANGLFRVTDDVFGIENNAFNDAKEITELYLGAHFHEMTSSLQTMFNTLENLKKISVSENNDKYKEIDGVLFDKDATSLVKYPNARNGDYLIPEATKSIDPFAFHGANCLKKLTIKGDISFNPSRLSYDNSIEEFEIINNPNYASFSGDIYSKDFKTILATAPHKSEIVIKDGTEVLGSSSINSNIASIDIPQSVKTIANRAINCSSLKEVIFSNNIEKLGDYSFGYDYFKIKVEKLFFKGSIEELESIDKGDKNIVLARAERYYYSENKPTEFAHHYWHYENNKPTIW